MRMGSSRTSLSCFPITSWRTWRSTVQRSTTRYQMGEFCDTNHDLLDQDRTETWHRIACSPASPAYSTASRMIKMCEWSSCLALVTRLSRLVLMSAVLLDLDPLELPPKQMISLAEPGKYAGTLSLTRTPSMRLSGVKSLSFA